MGHRFAFGPLEGYLPAVYLCGGDQPRGTAEPVRAAFAGVIGGADGPTAIFCSDGETASNAASDDPRRRGVCSSLCFAPRPVTWRMTFPGRPWSGVEVDVTDAMAEL